jgi:hypothetical protein
MGTISDATENQIIVSRLSPLDISITLGLALRKGINHVTAVFVVAWRRTPLLGETNLLLQNREESAVT